MSDGGPAPATCRREIEALHAFFVDWYTGADVSFDRLDRALAPGFEMVTPDGECLDRAAVLAGVREKRETHAPGTFDIDIRNATTVARGEAVAVLRYEEWQTEAGEETGRVSTATFRADADAPVGVAWAGVHETWL